MQAGAGAIESLVSKCGKFDNYNAGDERLRPKLLVNQLPFQVFAD